MFSTLSSFLPAALTDRLDKLDARPDDPAPQPHPVDTNAPPKPSEPQEAHEKNGLVE
jgi:hypothetical protein